VPAAFQAQSLLLVDAGYTAPVVELPFLRIGAHPWLNRDGWWWRERAFPSGLGTTPSFKETGCDDFYQFSA
jgi:hypothetical protein